MSIYIAAYLLVVLLLMVSLLNEKYINVCYIIAFIMMSCLLVFRYGQGTDYLSYEWIYSVIPSRYNLAEFNKAQEIVSTEIGWNFLCCFAKNLGIEFKYFVSGISIIEMLLIDRFISKIGYDRYKVLVLVLLFPTVYLIYMFSILREGLVICLFLGVALPWLIEKKYVLYVLLVLLLSTIHTAAFVFLLVFIVNIFSIRQLKLLVVPSLILGFIISRYGMALFTVVGNVLGKASYIERTEISLAAMIERIVMLAIVLYLYKLVDTDDRVTTVLLKCYIVGICTYFCLIAISLTASRIGILFKVLEVWLLPCLLAKVKRNTRLAIASLLVVITSFMLVKNIKAEIVNGGYFEDISVKNYPYVTIFDEKDKIDEYRYTIYSDLI